LKSAPIELADRDVLSDRLARISSTAEQFIETIEA
jgi:hypothetical protein